MIDNLLIACLKFLVISLLILWVIIAISVIYRFVRTKKLKLIEKTFAGIISHYLYPLPGEKPDLIQIQRGLRAVGIVPSKPKNVQYLIDLMIRTQRSLLGENYDKLVILFNQIPPYGVAARKLSSEQWHIKARGIREIYEMDQKQYLIPILKQRNHENLYVRREAQIALVVFMGWESLRFLPYLKREMTLWQQIKIVEKLYDLHPKPNLKHLRNAYKSEKTYANELLMRIIRKYNLITELDFILSFIDNRNFDTRESAIYCISSFYLSEDQLVLLKEKYFKIPSLEQQIQLLKYIDKISFEKDLEFYTKLLHHNDDSIKLTAAEILWNNGYQDIVQDFYYQQYAKQPINV